MEDNKGLLKNLKQEVEATNLAEPIIYCDNSDDFIKQVQKEHSEVDFLILDIELDGENITGLDVAKILKKPTLFASGKSKEYLQGIEDVDLDNDFPVESILKPTSVNKLSKILPKLFAQIDAQKEPTMSFNFDGINKEVRQSEIVYIESIFDNSNNKTVYFKKYKPITLYNFSFNKMFEKGYDVELFTQPHQSFRVNKNHILGIKKQVGDSKQKYDILVSCMNKTGKMEEKEIPISENYRTKINNLLKKP